MDKVSRTSRLREYIEALHMAESTTDQDWINSWSKVIDNDYMPKEVLINYLRYCICKETELLLDEAS